MQSTINLPISNIQPDFEAVIHDVREGTVPEDSFWLSFYKSGEQSVHGKVALSLDEKDRNLILYDGKDGVVFDHPGKRDYLLSCAALSVLETRAVVPSAQFTDPLPRSANDQYRKIHAFDIAPDGSQFATGYEDGSVLIIPTISRRPTSAYSTCKPHLNTITSLRFFPSSKVLLTSGVDFALNILPADLPSTDSSRPTRLNSVRSFKGHTRAITSTAIISAGRNILSTGRDGTVRLWDVPSGSQIRSESVPSYVAINAMSVGEKAEGAFVPPPNGEEQSTPLPADAREVDTNDKVAFCGLQDGSFIVFDLGMKLPVFHSTAQKGSSSLSSIAYSASASLVATGSSNGLTSVYDTRSMETPLTTFCRNGASIEDLVFVSTQGGSVGLAIATDDGLPYIADVRPEGPSVRAELVGTDCDGVRSIRVRSAGGEVWTAGDDGIVRKYEVGI
ncbi:hypothetical protein QCA50_006244 [Cerrena zonata]|uniref:WD40 repeat-like protein n=1 Tax=Cerrena zonata TaxID=2478898 RepID=A0AAW0GNQ0_9APHY